MDLFQKKPYLLWGSILLFSLLLSLLFFLAVPPDRIRRVLFFPGAGSNTLTGEIRYLQNRPDREQKIESVVEALVLGPMSVRHLRVVPKRTEVRSVLYRGATAYIDLGSEILFEEREVPLGAREIVEAVRRNLLFNFPFLKDVVITVDGQLPGQPYFEKKPAAQKQLQ